MSEFEIHLAPVMNAAYSLARNLTRQPADAEDLVQDAAIRAFKAFAQFERGSNFKAWFLRILVNTFLNETRRQKARPQIADGIADDDENATPEYERAPAHARDEPAAVLLQRLQAEEIRAAFAQLAPDFRVVALLYFLEQRSYQEIAQILDCPIGTVRSRLHRSRRQLQNALRESEPEA